MRYSLASLLSFSEQSICPKDLLVCWFIKCRYIFIARSGSQASAKFSFIISFFIYFYLLTGFNNLSVVAKPWVFLHRGMPINHCMSDALSFKAGKWCWMLFVLFFNSFLVCSIGPVYTDFFFKFCPEHLKRENWTKQQVGSFQFPDYHVDGKTQASYENVERRAIVESIFRPALAFLMSIFEKQLPWIIDLWREADVCDQLWELVIERMQLWPVGQGCCIWTMQ